MAWMTDTAFRRLVKRHGGWGLVGTEMVSAEGLVRGVDRTLEYAEYTEEERPISIQIFGGAPAKTAAAPQLGEGTGRPHSRDRENARRLERRRSERADAGEDGAGRRRSGNRDPRTDGGAEL